MALELHNTENPISNAERLKINENWQRIISGYSYLQQQIKVLAGGAEVDELIQRLNDAIDNANVAVQQAIDANNTATQEAIEANNTALQTALDSVSQTLVQLNEAMTNANEATTEANAAKQGALDATAQAQTAINKMQSMLDNLRSRGVWDAETQYYTNNIVTRNNNSYIALQDSIGRTPPTAPLQVNAYWSLLAGQGLKGDRGEKGDTGAALSIIDKLTDESQLPVTGEPGDAYTINGDLYVWSEQLQDWENVGNIKGEKGDKGDKGDTGVSAYQTALDNGFVGTEEEWLESLKGDKGEGGMQYGGLLTGDVNFDTLESNKLYQVGGLTNGSVGRPPINTGVIQNGEYSTLECSQFGTYNIQRLTQIVGEQAVVYRVMELGKPWKAWKGLETINTFQAAKKSQNLGITIMEKSLPYMEWKNNNVTSEYMDILIPMPPSGLVGIIEMTLTSVFANSDATGGAVIRYHIGSNTGGVYNQRMEIVSMSDGFANNFFVDGWKVSADKSVLYTSVTKRSAKNPLLVNLKLYNSATNSEKNLLEGTVTTMNDHGALISPEVQQSIYVQRDRSNRFVGTFPVILMPNGQVGHVFHKSADSRLHIAPTAGVDQSNVVDWSNAFVIGIDGSVFAKRMFVDGVDLKQSVSNGKAEVNQAVTDKGIYTAPDAPFATTASNVRKIQTGGGGGAKSIPVIPANGNYTFSVDGLKVEPNYAFVSWGGRTYYNRQTYFAQPTPGVSASGYAVVKTGDTWRMDITLNNYSGIQYNGGVVDYFIQ